MAIVINKEKERDSIQWLQEAVRLIKMEGIDNPSLYQFIQTEWLNPIRAIGEFAHHIEEATPELRSVFKEGAEGVLSDESDEVLMTYFRIVNNFETDYKFYFNTVTQEFTRTPKALETVFLYEDDDFSLEQTTSQKSRLSKAAFQYMYTLSQDDEFALIAEIFRRMMRRTNTNIRELSMEFLRDRAAKDIWAKLSRGEVLEIDTWRKDEPEYYGALFIALDNYYLHEDNYEELLRQAIHEALIPVSDFQTIYSMIYDSHYLSITKLGRIVVEEYIAIHGIEPVIDKMCYTESEGVKVLQPYRPVYSPLNIIYLLDDESFEALFKRYLLVVTNKEVDFPVQDTDRVKYLHALEHFLDDERSKVLIKKWGGFYSNSQYLGKYSTYYLDEFTVEDYIRRANRGLPVLREGVVYIQDEELDKIQLLFDKMDVLPQFRHGRSYEDWNKVKKNLRPVSQLQRQLDGEDVTVDDFVKTDYVIVDWLVYVPALSVDGPVTMKEPVGQN